ncbi:type VII secretion target [Antrihabitans cavernicola]|nr:type VII secretion target [Spelaeibacter cavernicola]
MGTNLEVDTAALRGLATALNDDADQVAQLDPARPIAAAALEMPSSQVGAAVGAAADPVAKSYRRMADQIRSMSAAAQTNATSYDATEEAFRRQFMLYRLGL